MQNYTVRIEITPEGGRRLGCSLELIGPFAVEGTCEDTRCYALSEIRSESHGGDWLETLMNCLALEMTHSTSLRKMRKLQAGKFAH